MIFVGYLLVNWRIAIWKAYFLTIGCSGYSGLPATTSELCISAYPRCKQYPSPLSPRGIPLKESNYLSSPHHSANVSTRLLTEIISQVKSKDEKEKHLSDSRNSFRRSSRLAPSPLISMLKALEILLGRLAFSPK